MQDFQELSLRTSVTADDCEHVRAITRSTGFFTDPEVEVAVELVEERLAKGPASGYHFIFAEVDGRPVGYSCFGPIPCTVSSYDLYWIAVDADVRGRRVGTRLLDESEKAVARLGGTRVYVETSSRAQYEPTRRFYERRGYRREALLEDFYAPGDGKVMYVKAL
jgi:ribosomal protein S18 acetylase RimI-like enzyme